MTVARTDHPGVAFQPAVRLQRPDEAEGRAAEATARTASEDDAADQRMQDDGAPLLNKLLGRLTAKPIWSALGLRRLYEAVGRGRPATQPWRLQLRAARKERWRLRNEKAKAAATAGENP